VRGFVLVLVPVVLVRLGKIVSLTSLCTCRRLTADRLERHQLKFVPPHTHNVDEAMSLWPVSPVKEFDLGNRSVLAVIVRHSHLQRTYEANRLSLTVHTAASWQTCRRANRCCQRRDKLTEEFHCI